MSSLTVTKHHGLGNDFLVLLDLAGVTPIDAALARALCDRHRGVGADGLIRATRPVAADGDLPAGGGLPAGGISATEEMDAARAGASALTFELRNANGSAAEMSGNGMRCLAQAALDAGVVRPGEPFTVLTPAGPRPVTVRPTESPAVVWAEVGMGVPVVDGEAERCNVGHGRLGVHLGNPHLVVLGPDPRMVPVEELGPELERAVPGGQNVEFVTLGPGPDALTMRVWERGVGETLACGTGAAAAAVALHRWGRVGRRVLVHQPGGDAAVELRPDGSVVLSGPSERIATCVVERRATTR